MVVFEEKPEYPEKTSQCREENQKTQPTYHATIEPEPHWWEASALTTAPSLHPMFPQCSECEPIAVHVMPRNH